jgi:hypothetical protein
MAIDNPVERALALKVIVDKCNDFHGRMLPVYYREAVAALMDEGYGASAIAHTLGISTKRARALMDDILLSDPGREEEPPPP